MRISHVDFNFEGDEKSTIVATVRFNYERGKPTTVIVFLYDGTPGSPRDHTYGNRKGALKACITHAREVLDRAVGKPAKTNFAKQRARADKPELRVVGGLRFRGKP